MAMDKQAQGACWLWLVIIPVLLGLSFVGLGGLFIWLRLLFWYHG